jgi:tetratricopeptide (TPR) repeat protein
MADRQSSRRYKEEGVDQENSEKEIIQIRRTPFQKALLAGREFLQQSWGPKVIYGFAGVLLTLLIVFFLHDTVSSSQSKTYYQIDRNITDIRSLPDGSVKTGALIKESENALDLCDSFWQTKHAAAGCLLAASLASEAANSSLIVKALEGHSNSGAPESVVLFSKIQLGYAYEGLGETEKALSLYDSIIPKLESLKMADSIYYRKAEIFFHNGQIEDTEKTLNKILSTEDDPATEEQARKLLLLTLSKKTAP